MFYCVWPILLNLKSYMSLNISTNNFENIQYGDNITENMFEDAPMMPIPDWFNCKFISGEITIPTP